MNRASRRAVLFATDDDYHTFLEVLAEATVRFQMRLVVFAVMPNHWHLILWPDSDQQLSRFMHWLTGTHAQRWHAAHGTAGTGTLYQGRYKAIPIESDRPFLTVARYVERNPVRAWLVERVQDWRWSSAWHREHHCTTNFLHDWPVPMPANWLEIVNEPQTQVHLSTVREAIVRGQPYGSEEWRRETASRLGLEHTLRSPGRPSGSSKPFPTPVASPRTSYPSE
jgi:putative transposase